MIDQTTVMDDLFWENPDNLAIHFIETNEEESVEDLNDVNDLFKNLEKSYLKQTLREPKYD